MQITIDTSQPLSDTDARILHLLLDHNFNPHDWPSVDPQPPKPAPVEEKEPIKSVQEQIEEEHGDVVKDAIQKATALVSEGHRDRVKQVLTDIGAKRVSDLTPDQAAEFLVAIDDE